MKILIIEDEFNLADAIASMLKSEKYEADIRTDGEHGLNDALTGIYYLITQVLSYFILQNNCG